MYHTKRSFFPNPRAWMHKRTLLLLCFKKIVLIQVVHALKKDESHLLFDHAVLIILA